MRYVDMFLRIMCTEAHNEIPYECDAKIGYPSIPSRFCHFIFVFGEYFFFNESRISMKMYSKISMYVNILGF